MKQYIAYRYDEDGRRHRELVNAPDDAAASVICSMRGWHYSGPVEQMRIIPGCKVLAVIPAEQAKAMTPEQMEAMVRAYSEREGQTVH